MDKQNKQQQQNNSYLKTQLVTGRPEQSDPSKWIQYKFSQNKSVTYKQNAKENCEKASWL